VREAGELGVTKACCSEVGRVVLACWVASHSIEVRLVGAGDWGREWGEWRGDEEWGDERGQASDEPDLRY
jgi:hypothetical protein